jgi:hypothetical protein
MHTTSGGNTMSIVTDYAMHEVTEFPAFVITATDVDIDDVTPGFEQVAQAADREMWEILATDLDGDES